MLSNTIEETFTAPPLAPDVQDKQWSSINTFDLALDVGRGSGKDIEKVRVNIIEALGKVPSLEGIDMSLTIGERLQLLLMDTKLLIYTPVVLDLWFVRELLVIA